MLQHLHDETIGQHVTILGWLYVAYSAFGLVICCLFVFLLSGVGIVANDSEATPVLLLVATCGGAFLALTAAPGLIAGIGLLRRQGWARILALILGFFQLPSLPIGTALGLYTFWVLFQDAAPAYFARSAPSTAIVPSGEPGS
jgi:hypothetical protein